MRSNAGGSKGPCIDSSGARRQSGRKPWRGCGDPLKRGLPNYWLVTPNPYAVRLLNQPLVVAVSRPPRVTTEVVDLITPHHKSV